MTPPREIRAGQTFEITSRAIHRAFFFAPIAPITNLFLFLLGYFAKKRGIILYGVVLMANHYHLLGLDVLGTLPDFVRDLNSIFARALNVHHRKDDKIWSGDGYHIVRPVNPEDVLNRMVYLAANPAKANLVNRAQDYPGAITTPGMIGRSRTHTRPDFFFSDDGPWPDSVDVTFEVPECMAMTRAEYSRAFDEALRTREQEHRAARKAAGTAVVGAAVCRAVTKHDRPRSHERHGRRKYSIACRNVADRLAEISRIRRFREEYWECRGEWSEDVSGVVFPNGTWWVRRYAGVEVRPPD